MTKREQAKRNADRRGLALIGATLLIGMGGLFYGAIKADAARGISVSESLASAGIGRAAPTEAPAVPVRLVGMCDGRLMGAMEESAFPAGCEWIAPLADLESGK